MPKRKGNLLVIQSGGPTHVINQSLAGVVAEASRSEAFGNIYGADHGMHGLMEGRFIDLARVPKNRWPSIARTPGASLGTSRRKMKPEDLPLALDQMRQLGVTCLVSIGGNDSAENAHLFGEQAAEAGYPLTVMGVPKTVDNDLPETDHCPGYGSAARFLALATMSTARDAEAMGRERPITVVEAMGRNAGWLPLAAGLGKREERDGPHVIVSPERPVDEDWFCGVMEQSMCRWGFAVAAVSETAKSSNGPLGQSQPEFVDEFGHAYYPSPAEYLARLVGKRLRVRVRFEKPGTIARTMASTVSKTDATEAYVAGVMAVRHALAGEHDKMVTLVRQSDRPYRCGTGLAPLEAIAGKERLLPPGYADTELGLPTEAFRSYAEPLLGGRLPRFGRVR